MKKAVFFDRDGIVNVDTNYVHKIEEFVFCERIFDVMLFFQKKEYLLFIITNQSGIGRGIYTENEFHKLTHWMVEELKKRGIILEKVYFDPFHPVHGLGHYKKDSFNRKPKPGMILDAQKSYDICLNQSILIGDKESDIQAGVAVDIQKTFFINLLGVCANATQSFRSLADFFNYLQIHSSEF